MHWLGEPETTNRTQFLNEAVKLASDSVVSVLVDTDRDAFLLKELVSAPVPPAKDF